MTSDPAISVAHRPENDRYTVSVDGEPAGFAAYRAEGDVLVFTHTEVSPRYGGRGVGSALAAAALDDVRARKRRVRPQCAFIAAYIDRHPAYRDLLADA